MSSVVNVQQEMSLDHPAVSIHCPLLRPCCYSVTRIGTGNPLLVLKPVLVELEMGKENVV